MEVIMSEALMSWLHCQPQTLLTWSNVNAGEASCQTLSVATTPINLSIVELRSQRVGIRVKSAYRISSWED